MLVLRKTKQKINKRPLFGFDVETANDNKTFILGSIVNEKSNFIFYYKSDMLAELKHNRIFKNSLIFATNLSFDFFQILFGDDAMQYFYTLFRGSKLIVAEVYIKGNSFVPPKTKGAYKITFLDSLNYANLSVEKMGMILNKPKLNKPEFLGKHPISDVEYDELLTYNLQDSKITYEFMNFLIPSFEELGATFKNTIASTSMSLFRNVYLDRDYYTNDEEILIDVFDSYYGGRTEAFKRGHIEDVNYYDINSLYPFVMYSGFYPNPNNIRKTRLGSLTHVMQYEGISKVRMYVPYNTIYPLLPFRREDKSVIFPVGEFEGSYTHIELRRAIAHGAKIIKFYHCIYSNTSVTPFKHFVEDLYKKRLYYKNKKSPLEFVIKIIMNSLYGKFGQRFINRDNWIHESLFTVDMLEKNDMFERKGCYIRFVQAKTKPSCFCIPLWASYITAYARLRLHDYLLKHNPIYCDTDSIITKDEIKTSQNLGEMKLELKIQEGVIVRPKFYALKSGNEEIVKIKGLGRRLDYLKFERMLTNPLIYYNKFATFKEALRRDFIPGQIIETHKEFSLEDKKRIWKNSFNPKILQESKPLILRSSG